MMKVVGVTGSSGFIGRRVVEVLESRGYKVKALNHDETGDVSNLKGIEKWFKDIDGVIHLAAVIGLEHTKREFYKTNVIGTRNIVSLAKKYGVKAVVASTIMVFNETKDLEKDEWWNKKKSSNNKYVQSKLRAELEIKKYNEEAVVVYPCIVVDKNKLNNYGFKGNFLMKFIWELLGGGIPGGIMAMIGNGSRYMNIVELDDVAEGIVLALEKGKNGEDYIIGGVNITAKNYLKMMRKITGKAGVNIRIPSWITRRMGIGEPEGMFFSSKKAEMNLGYKPKWKLR